MQTGAVLHCLAVCLVPRLSQFGFCVMCDVAGSLSVYETASRNTCTHSARLVYIICIAVTSPLTAPLSLPRITSQSLLLVSLSVPPQCPVTGPSPPTAATLSFSLDPLD